MISLERICAFLLFVSSAGALLLKVDYRVAAAERIEEVRPLSRTGDGALSNFTLKHLRRVVHKSSKWLPFWVVVSNSSCISQEENRMGTCYTPKRCERLRGKPSGVCGSGFGVCCIVSAACNSVVSQNETVFQSPNFPDPYTVNGAETCEIKIVKPSSNICQLRLDFIKMDLAHADIDGNCVTDAIQMFGMETSLPPNVCGPLSGQHLYFDFGNNDKATMLITTDGRTYKIPRKWQVQITFIECSSRTRAPSGCLQHFTELTGRVKILGYPMTPHLAGLDYTICVRGEANAGSIFWFLCGNEPVGRSFLFQGSSQTIPSTQIFTGPCNGDYITIMSDKDAMTIPKNHDRYCGNSFTQSPPYAVLSRARPFIIRVKTDLTEDNQVIDKDNTGFCLDWLQNPTVM